MMVKIFAIAFLAFVGLAAAQRPVRSCPDEDGEYAVILRNPEDCGSFFICANGEPVLFTCPSGLEFNSILRVCDWPASAGCRVRPTTTRRPSTTTRRNKPRSEDVESNENEETK